MNLSRLHLALLYIIFFVSGASSLISEITWNRMLVLILGNTVTATSMILAAFMGGLALGSYWGGRTFSKMGPTFLPYSILEICIGLYVLFSPLLFQPLSNLFGEIAPVFAGSAILPLARLVIAFASLFIPAFLMGATFPAIVSVTASEPFGKRALRTGYLYSINTLGAALGCLIAGYLLLPRFGAKITLAFAFSLNMAAAAGGLILNTLKKRTVPVLHVRPKIDDTPITGRSLFILISITTFIVGFVALSYQVLLTRLVILFFGNHLIVFTIVLTAFLLGTGISALLGTWAHGLISRSGHLFTFIVMAAGITLVAPPFLLIKLSTAQNQWAVQNQDIMVVIIMLVPTLLIGSLLPIAIKIFQTELRVDTTVSAGKLYALNTFGGMLGGGLTNFFLVPMIGIQGILSVFAVIFLTIGLSLLWNLKKSTLRWSAAVACALILGILINNLPHKLEKLYTSKLTEYSGGDIDPQLKLHFEGRVTTATVIDFPYLGFRDMFLNGVEEASTRFVHVQLFKLLGLLPLLVHESDSPKDALMIAFGAGIAAGTTAGAGMVSSLDVVDLNPDIEKINDLFKDVNGDAYNNPNFNFITEDGRNYLLMTRKKYPVIISDSTHPRVYDSWILYTEEFYQDVKEHLTPDGVFAQWIPLSDFSLELYKIMLNTFTKVFPNSTFWVIYGTDQAFLLATPEPFRFDLQQVQRKLDRIPASLKLKEYQLDRAVDLTGFFVMDSKGLAEFIGDEKRTNTDDLPYSQQYSLKESSPLRTQSFDRYQTSIIPYLKNADDSDLVVIRERQVVARAMERFFFFNDLMALDEAYSIRPEDGNVLFYKEMEARKIRMASEKSKKDFSKKQEQADRLKEKIEKSPGKADNHIELANLYIEMNITDLAESSIKKALEYSPDSIPAHNIMGLIQAIKGNRQEAEKSFQYVLKKEPANKSARKNLIRIYAEYQKFEKAIELLLGSEINEDNPGGTDSELYQHYVTLAGAYYAIKDYKNAEDYLLRSLEIYPGHSLSRLYLARIYLANNRREEAISQLDHILEVNPFNRPALTQLIGLYREDGMDSKVKPLQKNLNRINRKSLVLSQKS